MVENIIEAMVDAVLVVDVEGRIVLANTAASTLTSVPRDALKNMPVASILVDDSSGLRTVVRQRIAGGDVLRRDESWLVNKTTNTRIPVSVTGSAVIDEAGTLQGIVIVARDVREIHQLLADKEAEIVRRRVVEDELRVAKSSIEEQLDQAREQLLLLERRATLGTLAGGVGHELKNIAQMQVAAVDEISRSLEMGGDITNDMRHLLPDLERVGEHITAHGTRLLQLARPGPDRVDPFDLNQIVRDVISMLRGAGKLKFVEVILDLPAEPLVVTVNRTRIEQILINLVGNAVDALDKKKQITITTRASDDRSMVVCQVKDTGVGIPPDQLSKIFEPFFTTKPEDKGTGLGLPVARGIVTNYGGTMTVTSVVGEGTTFQFTLKR